MQISLIDILFLVTVALLVFNGLRNGVVFSLINLVGLPIGFAVAYFYGPRFTALLAANGLPATPLISYIALFFGTVLVIHIIGTMVRGVIRVLPIIGLGDALLGGLVGFAEAWLLWVFLLVVLGSFLANAQGAAQQGVYGASAGIQTSQLKEWHDFYNEAITTSLFARVNGFFVKTLPNIS